MADKDQVLKERVDHSGIFNFSEFYSYAHSWLKAEEFGVQEEKYNEKVSGNQRDITLEWKATKTLSDYLKEEITLKFEIKELTDVEIEIDGKKKKSNKGRIGVELKGFLVRDPDSKWDATPFYRFLKEVYAKWVVPGRIDSMQDKVKGDVRDLKEEMKAFLSLSGRR